MNTVYVISSVHPQYGKVQNRDLYLYKWNVGSKAKTLVISQVLHWQCDRLGGDLYRDIDGKIRPIQEIADRLGAQINPRDC